MTLADYVLQRALTVVEGEQKEALFNKVSSQLTGMKKSGSAYSKHLSASKIYSTVCKLTDDIHS